MFCNQCGQSLPEGSRFCNHCGAQAAVTSQAPREQISREQIPREQIPHEQAGAISRIDSEPEQAVFTIRPTLVFVITWFILAAIIWIIVAALVGITKSAIGIPGTMALFLIAISGLLVFAIPVYKYVLRRREVYTLTNHKLEMRYGILSKLVRNIPLRNIQNVTVTATFFQRILKLGDIVIDSASESGEIRLLEIHDPDHYADVIMSELRRRY